MDSVLLPYLTAVKNERRQQHRDELLSVCAAPLIRQVLRRRLGFYVSAQGANENNQDAEDLYQEAMTRVVRVLNQLHLAPGLEIENFDLYVSRIASNICTDFRRAKSPARTRLKQGLRHLLKRHKDLVSWEHSGEIWCGFATWRNSGKSAFMDEPTQDLETRLDSFQLLHFGDEDIRLAPISQIVAELFYWIGGPVEIDVMVRMIAHLLDIKDEQNLSLDDPARAKWEYCVVSNARTGDFHVKATELLAQLWQAVTKLPAEQRDAFVLSFEDDAGQDLFTMLRAAEIVNWDEVAQGMDRSVQEVTQLRMRMPMNGTSMAEELKASRENVYKWRFRAIRRLKTELRG